LCDIYIISYHKLNSINSIDIYEECIQTALNGYRQQLTVCNLIDPTTTFHKFPRPSASHQSSNLSLATREASKLPSVAYTSNYLFSFSDWLKLSKNISTWCGLKISDGRRRNVRTPFPPMLIPVRQQIHHDMWNI